MTDTTMTTTRPRYADDVQVGDVLPALVRRPTTVALLRYCAVTWNSHRIHFDQAYAAEEGYPDVLVQSHLHGAWLTTLCTEWMGSQGRLVRLAYSVRRFACPGDVLSLDGTVTGVRPDGDGVVVALDLRETRESDGVVCVPGDAEIWLPRRAGGA